MSPVRYTIARDRVRWNIVDGQAVLIHVETSYYYSLNRTGTVIWEKLLAQPLTRDEITDAVAQRFGKTPRQVSDDVAAFLEQMLSEELIQVVPR
jgi:hypothetical protein